MFIVIIYSLFILWYDYGKKSMRVFAMENDNSKPKRNRSKNKFILKILKKVILIIVGTVMLAGLGFGGWKFYENTKNKSENNIIEKQRIEFDQSVKEIEDEALGFEAEGRPDKAIDAYDKAAKESDDERLAYVFKLRSALIDYNVGNIETALYKLLALEESNKNEDISQLIGGVYFDLDDYINAKLYYQKAIELADKSQVDNTDIYKEKISQIEELIANE